MTDAQAIAEQFLAALAANDAAQLEAVLAEDCGLRLYGWEGVEIHRPRRRVIERLLGEVFVKFESLSTLVNGDRAAVEYRVLTVLGDRYVEYYRSAFLTVAEGRVAVLDMYFSAAYPSGRRKGYIAPATLSEAEVIRVFEEQRTSGDNREWMPPNMRGRRNLQLGMSGSDLAHPGSNNVGGARWTAEEADARIEEIIAFHRQRNIGFQWFINPSDTPQDLAERLERHGLMHVGDTAMMARIGLDDVSDIPVNPEVKITLLDGSSDSDIEAALQIIGEGFHMPPEQIDEMRQMVYSRLRDPKMREQETVYLAWLNGEPVGQSRLMVRAALAYLGGAATRPAARRQHVYSTLLRRRLEDARRGQGGSHRYGRCERRPRERRSGGHGVAGPGRPGRARHAQHGVARRGCAACG